LEIIDLFGRSDPEIMIINKRDILKSIGG